MARPPDSHGGAGHPRNRCWDRSGNSERSRGQTQVRGALEKSRGQTQVRGALERNWGQTQVRGALEKSRRQTQVRGALERSWGQTQVRGALERSWGQTEIRNALKQPCSMASTSSPEQLGPAGGQYSRHDDAPDGRRRQGLLCRFSAPVNYSGAASRELASDVRDIIQPPLQAYQSRLRHKTRRGT